MSAFFGSIGTIGGMTFLTFPGNVTEGFSSFGLDGIAHCLLPSASVLLVAKDSSTVESMTRLRGARPHREVFASREIKTFFRLSLSRPSRSKLSFLTPLEFG